LNPDFRDMLYALCAEHAEFLIVGAYALAAHGLPRATGDIFQIGIAPRRIDILTAISGVQFADAWPRRKLVSLAGLEVSVLGRDDLLVNKRAAGRPQDLADVERLERAGPN
jgi:hypothetical protein